MPTKRNSLRTDGLISLPSRRSFETRITDGLLSDWLDPVRVLLVDEYQDTNALQESIYQTMASHALGRGGWAALVGDDDQSLFRFRAATVELFVEAPTRFCNAVPGMQFDRLSLNVNRRSSWPIIEFANQYMDIDDSYQAARVPDKPHLAGSTVRDTWSISDNIPVLGLFRPSVDELAHDLTDLMATILGDGLEFSGVDEPIRQEQPGDIAIIGYSTQRRSSTDKPRV